MFMLLKENLPKILKRPTFRSLGFRWILIKLDNIQVNYISIYDGILEDKFVILIIFFSSRSLGTKFK